LSSASFYVPYKAHAPLVLGNLLAHRRRLLLGASAVDLRSLRTNDLLGVLGATPNRTLLWCWFWGAMWGFGGLTFGSACVTGPVARHGRCARPHHRDRHDGAADLPWHAVRLLPKRAARSRFVGMFVNADRHRDRRHGRTREGAEL
jgi:hypothetical protein